MQLLTIGVLLSIFSTIYLIYYYKNVLIPGEKKIAKDSVGRTLLLKIDGKKYSCQIFDCCEQYVNVSYWNDGKLENKWIKFTVRNVIGVIA